MTHTNKSSHDCVDHCDACRAACVPTFTHCPEKGGHARTVEPAPGQNLSRSERGLQSGPGARRRSRRPRVGFLAAFFLLAPAAVMAQEKKDPAPPDAVHHMPSPGAPAPPQAHDMNDHMPMTGLFGPYGMSREASGTSWQPESTPTSGYHFMLGSWMLMAHAYADLVFDYQGGARGDSHVFGPNMGMLMASRRAGRGTVGLRAMLSLEPATVGREGYPLLLQTGETADGETPLIDRQHPHDLLMELAATYSHPVGGRATVFGYLGLPGEPALGPPTFMHRFSGMSIPEAPILHHWLDSTHITFGTATAGVSWPRVKLEASSFTGREPDEKRWNFDEPKFDSYSGRISFNPTANWALQASAGHLTSPEQLEPEVDVERFTASVSYNRRLRTGNVQVTAAWGANRKEGMNQDGVLLESVYWTGTRHTVFARAEWAEKDELFESEPLAHEVFRVAKLSAGYAFDVVTAGRLVVAVGAMGSVYQIPADLEPVYGTSPLSYMLFLRTVIR